MPSLSASCLAIHHPGFCSCGAATTGWRSDVQPVRPKPTSSSSWRSRNVDLRQHDVRVAGDLARHRVDDDQQVEPVDRLQRLGRVRQRVENVRRVDEPALDRIRLRGQRGIANAGRDAFVGERIARAIGAVGVGLVRRRILGQRIRRDLHAGRQVEPALAAPVAEQRGEQRDRAAALRVVAVPVHAPSRVHERRRPVARELACGDANQVSRRCRSRPPPIPGV